MTDVASQTVGAVVNHLMGHITKHVGYITSSAKHVRHMENRMKHLEGTSIDVKEHKYSNDRSNKVIPACVPDWLQEVEKINDHVKSISSSWRMGCFDIKGRYQVAAKALKACLESLIKDISEITWSDAQIPLGRIPIPSKVVSSSIPLARDTQTGSKSRDQTFKVALDHLQDDNTHMIALCGMGGVGKTTLMEQLKRVAKDKTMFNWIAMAVVGRNSDTKSIQHAIAVRMGVALETEKDDTLRAEYLRKSFEKLSESMEKTLVILDDVWNHIELKDLGLSPLPNGVKLLLTSRDASICRQIAPDVKVVQVDVLEETEARELFFQITQVSEQEDHDLYKIGSKIVKKCGGLPLAIKVIAPNLRYQRIYVWKNTLHRMTKNIPYDQKVQKVIEISYENIKEAEEKAIFRLCGMFPRRFLYTNRGPDEICLGA